MHSPPIVVLGVSRSGTRLLKEMLDSHSRVAIPHEAYFIPALWARHGPRVASERIIADFIRIRPTWWSGPTAEELRQRLPGEADFADAIDAIYRCYADAHGKERYGVKTPEYMQHLELLERAFPRAQYVHIVRDGRDAALSWVSMSTRRSAWRWPHGIAGFAHQWRTQIEAAERFAPTVGAARYHQLRYEDLVREPQSTLRGLCGYLEISFEPAMLEYHRRLDALLVPNHARLREPPTPGVRDWRREMAPRDVERFEAIAGDALSRLGYERAFPSLSANAQGRAALATAFATARVASWKAFLAAFRRTAVWRLRPL